MGAGDNTDDLVMVYFTLRDRFNKLLGQQA